MSSLTRVAVALHCTGWDLVKRAYMYALCYSLPDSVIRLYYALLSLDYCLILLLLLAHHHYLLLTHSLTHFFVTAVRVCCVVVRGAWSDVLSPVESLP